MSVATLHRVVEELELAMAPIERAVADPRQARQLLRHLGVELSLATVGLGEVEASLADVRVAFDTLRTGPVTIDLVIQAANTAWTAVAAIRNAVDGNLQDELGDVPLEILDDLAAALGRLPHYLLVRRVEANSKVAIGLLRALGLVDRSPEAATEVFRFDRFQAYQQNPTSQVIAEVYEWGAGQPWQSRKLLKGIDRTLTRGGFVPEWAGMPASWVNTLVGVADRRPAFRTLRLPLVQIKTPAGRIRHRAGLLLSPLPTDAVTPGAPLDSMMISAWSNFGDTLNTVEGVDWELPVNLNAPAAGIALRPSGVSAVGTLPKALKFGARQTESIEFGDLTLSGLFGVIEIPQDGSEFGFQAGTGPRGLRLRIDLGDGDGFLSDLVGDLTVEGSAEVSYSASTGLTVDASAGLELFVRGNGSGPIRIHGLYLGVSLAPDGVEAYAAAMVGVQLGKVGFALDRVGLQANLDFNSEGVFGPLADLQFDVLPPSGISIEIGEEGDGVYGAGRLNFGSNRYEGVLDLTLANGVEVGAIGILTTQNSATPDLPWSFLALINARGFAAPLPFGFVLSGIGGLVAVQRDMDQDALEAAFPTGGLEALLFPEDPVAELPRIASQLDSFFPIERGRFTAGLFAEITYGGVDVWTTQLGVLLSFPNPIKVTVVGKSTLKLPPPPPGLAEDDPLPSPIVDIRLDVLGQWRPEEKELSIRAELIDSKVGPLRLEGSAAFFGRFGSEPDWALSIGGFHTEFDPPAGFPTGLKRVGFDLGTPSDSGPLQVSLSARGFFALTPNTLQFGADVDASASILNFGVEGGFEIEVLIQRNPFELTADFTAYFGVFAGSTNIASLTVEGHLTGPQPWRLVAEARGRIGKLPEVKKQINIRFGREAQPRRLPAIDLAAETLNAISDPAAWSIQREGQPLVEVASWAGNRLGPDDAVVVEQSVAPIGSKVQHVGGRPLVQPGSIVQLVSTVDDNPDSGSDWNGMVAERVTRPFPPGEWQQLRDQERLRRPSFEPAPMGVAFTNRRRMNTGQLRAAPDSAGRVFLDGQDDHAPQMPVAAVTRRRV